MKPTALMEQANPMPGASQPAIALSEQEMFLRLMKAFEEEDIQYCIMGDTREYPQQVRSDIDIVVARESFGLLDGLMRKLATQTGAWLVQRLRHEQAATYYVLAWFDEAGDVRYIRPDVCGDWHRHGSLMLNASELLAGRRRAVGADGADRGFFTAGPGAEFLYYLVKRIDKGSLDERHGGHLSEVHAMDPAAANLAMGRFWSGADAKLIEQAAAGGDWTALKPELPRLRQSLRGAVKRSLGDRIQDGWRFLGRMMRPTGVMVGFFGPDGSGKSTVIERSGEELMPAFRRKQRMHLRPKLGKPVNQAGVPATDPHGQKPRSAIMSMVKMLYFLFDYGAGYWLRVRGPLIRSTLFIFDRYYYDILVDPIRFRYGGPAWLLRLIGWLVPRPDVMILLDATAEVLQQRKQEVTFEESRRQVEAYRAVIGPRPGAVIINADQPVADVVRDVNRAVLAFMERRMRRRMGE